jgi:hypothetical protein
MINELVKYIVADPTLSNMIPIPGQAIRRTNRLQVSNAFDGHANFLVSKVPTNVITNTAQNAWHKHREHTRMDHVNKKYPRLVDSSKKNYCISSNKTTSTTDSTNATESSIVDLEAKLEKEHAHHKKHLEEMCQAFTDELTKMKLEFTKEMTNAIENSERG